MQICCLDRPITNAGKQSHSKGICHILKSVFCYEFFLGLKRPPQLSLGITFTSHSTVLIELVFVMETSKPRLRVSLDKIKFWTRPFWAIVLTLGPRL